MSLIPEEFPVILTVFLSMGAWRLAKKNSIVKRLSSVETLGSISVLCVDKTGTITQNEMKVEKIWSDNIDNKELCEIMGLCCAEETYDPMEKAMLHYAKKLGIDKEKLFSGKKIKEYPFSNKTKMMGNVCNINNEIVLAAKGSPESILKVCELDENKIKQIEHEIREMLTEEAVEIAGMVMQYQTKSSDEKETCSASKESEAQTGTSKSKKINIE